MTRPNEPHHEFAHRFAWRRGPGTLDNPVRAAWFDRPVRIWAVSRVVSDGDRMWGANSVGIIDEAGNVLVTSRHAIRRRRD